MISRTLLLGWAVFALPALSLFVPSGYSWGALALTFLGLTAWRTWLRPTELPLELKFWAVTVTGAAAIWAMHVVDSHGVETRTLGLDRLLKYGLALLAIPAMLTKPRWPQALAWGCWVGAGLAGVIAVWDVALLHLARAEGHTNAIHFGNIALLLTTWSALWALNQCPHAKRTPSIRWAWLCCALGALALILSGSRGGWMAVPLLGALVLWQWKQRQAQAKTKNPLFGVLASVLALVVVLNTPQVHLRIHQAQAEWSGWVQTGESNNSVGQRLAHWKFAWTMFTERPFIGWGQAEYDVQRLEAITQGRVPEPLRHFNHAHNEWLDMAAKRGLLGLLGLASLYAIPGWLYARRLRSSASHTTRTLALCGLATVLGYLAFGLTQVMFAHNSGNMVYLFMNTLWLGMLAQHSSEPGHD